MARPSRGRIRDSVATSLGVIPPRWIPVIGAVLLGIVGDALYAASAHPWVGTFSAALLFSLAALLVGALFGFLFGLPHFSGGAAQPSRRPFNGSRLDHGTSRPEAGHAGGGAGHAGGGAGHAGTGEGHAGGGAGHSGTGDTTFPPPPERSDVSPSTNLQQIADWLTKLILGAGLTQIGHLPHASYVLFHAMSRSFGGAGSSGSAIAVAGGIAIYFAVAGFVSGWIATYFFLTPAMTRLERSATSHIEQASLLAGRAARAESSGDHVRADQLRAASKTQSDAAKTLYATVYARPRSDPSRIPAMDRAILDAATEALDGDPTPEDVKSKYDGGTQRDKEVALAMMAEDPSKLNADVLLRSISSSRTAVEQYQALRATLACAAQLSDDEMSQLRAAIQAEVDTGQHFSLSSARYRLARELLAILTPSPSEILTPSPGVNLTPSPGVILTPSPGVGS